MFFIEATIFKVRSKQTNSFSQKSIIAKHAISNGSYQKKVITEIFYENKGQYGYRCITLELRNRDLVLNHKTVLKFMTELGLKCKARMNKYRFYKGDV